MEAGTWYRDATPPNKSNAIDRSIDLASGDLPMLGPHTREDSRAMNPSACVGLESATTSRAAGVQPILIGQDRGHLLYARVVASHSV
jgi:hypothetical protein